MDEKLKCPHKRIDHDAALKRLSEIEPIIQFIKDNAEPVPLIDDVNREGVYSAQIPDSLYNRIAMIGESDG